MRRLICYFFDHALITYYDDGKTFLSIDLTNERDGLRFCTRCHQFKVPSRNGIADPRLLQKLKNETRSRMLASLERVRPIKHYPDLILPDGGFNVHPDDWIHGSRGGPL